MFRYRYLKHSKHITTFTDLATVLLYDYRCIPRDVCVTVVSVSLLLLDLMVYWPSLLSTCHWETMRFSIWLHLALIFIDDCGWSCQIYLQCISIWTPWCLVSQQKSRSARLPWDLTLVTQQSRLLHSPSLVHSRSFCSALTTCLSWRTVQQDCETVYQQSCAEPQVARVFPPKPANRDRQPASVCRATDQKGRTKRCKSVWWSTQY